MNNRLIFGFALLSVSGFASATQIVVPNVNTVAAGASNNAFPFNAGPMRYQQVFAASQLGGLSGTVRSFSYRVDESAGNAFSTSVDCMIWLSHTTKAPQGLDSTFDNNSGADKTLVFSGNMSISSAGNWNVFDVVFDINDVFSYNGTGNLLLEVVTNVGASTSQFDSAGTGLGVGGTPWTSRLYAFSSNATTGVSDGDDGMVTQFDIDAVPEPTTMAALGLGAAAFARRRRRS